MSVADVGGGPRETGWQDKASPKDMATSAISAVKGEAASFADSAMEKVAEQVDAKKDVATQTLGDFASAIRKAGEDLAQHDQSLAGQVVRQAAEGLESFSRSLSDRRPEELLDAVREFGRRNPTAFIAGSVLLGIALGRVAKSTEPAETAAPTGYKSPTEHLGANAPAPGLSSGGDMDDAAAPDAGQPYATGA